MESVKASLVKLGSWTIDSWYGLVPRPLPDFIPGECAITGEIRVFTTVAEGSKIEAEYRWENLRNGWVITND